MAKQQAEATRRRAGAVVAVEERRALHARVLADLRAFLEAHAMQGKHEPREFYEFERAFHERLREAQRAIVDELMTASALGEEGRAEPSGSPRSG